MCLSFGKGSKFRNLEILEIFKIPYHKKGDMRGRKSVALLEQEGQRREEPAAALRGSVLGLTPLRSPRALEDHKILRTKSLCSLFCSLVPLLLGVPKLFSVFRVG